VPSAGGLVTVESPLTVGAGNCARAVRGRRVTAPAALPDTCGGGAAPVPAAGPDVTVEPAWTVGAGSAPVASAGGDVTEAPA
jgi:hypothetical protein